MPPPRRQQTCLEVIAQALDLPYWTHAPAERQVVPIPEGTLDGVWHELRSVIVATISLPPREAGEAGVDIDVLGTHLEHRNEQVRLHQLKQCLAHTSPSRPHLLVGDLNAFSKADYSYRHWLMITSFFERRRWIMGEELVMPHLDALGYVDAWRELQRRRQASTSGQEEATDDGGSTSSSSSSSAASSLSSTTVLGDGRRSVLTEEERRMCTVWTSNPLLRIDYIMCSPAFARFGLVACRTLHECDASDHFPVLLDFCVP